MEKKGNYTRLDKDIISLLQRQVKHELDNWNKYKALANACDNKQLLGLKELFTKQSEGEYSHYSIFRNYLLDKRVNVPQPSIEGLGADDKDIAEMLLFTLDVEKVTTEYIKEIVKKAYEVQDYQTVDVCKDLLIEQVEEEALFINLLDRYTLVKECSSGDLLFDADVKLNYVK